MSIKNHEPTPFDERLFALALPESDASDYVMHDMRWQTNHTLYKRFGLRMNRSVELDDNTLILTDSWSQLNNFCNNNLISMWNFTLGPDIVPLQEDNRWLLYYDDVLLAAIESPDLEFSTHSGWYSPEYGTKLPCIHLCAEQPVHVNKDYIITLKYA